MRGPSVNWYQTENGSGVGLLENVGKLNMMLRRKNARCLGRNRNRGQGAPTRGNRDRGTGSSNRVLSRKSGFIGGTGNWMGVWRDCVIVERLLDPGAGE
jgi:hypothetical protein